MRRIVLATLLFSTIAYADPQSDQLFDEGRKLLDSGDNQGACDKFQKAIAIDPTAAGTMLNLGICNENLHKYATALYWFRRAGNYAGEGGAKPYEKVAGEHKSVLVSKVTTTQVQFSTGEPPAGTKVKLDHKDVAREDYGHLEIDPGHHVIEASSPGMKNFHKEIDIADKPGDTDPVKIEFVAGSNAIVIDRGKTRRRAAIATAIGGAVVMGFSVAYGFYERGKYCDYVDGGPCNNMGGPNHDGMNNNSAVLKSPQTPERAAIANGYMDNASNWGTGIFIGGAVLVAGAAVIYFTAPQPEKLDQTVFVPTIDRNGGGFAFTGRF